ncbi:MAG: glycoside hydrolase family 25 protein [Ruminococcus sp.]|nr:glycoside hydrolase family 25 protein [Ruminococcus sp.]
MDNNYYNEKEMNISQETVTQEAPKSRRSKRKKEKTPGKGLFARIKKSFTPAVSVLLVLCILLSGALAVVSVMLVKSEERHKAVYDDEDKITVAAKGDRIQLHNYALGNIAIPALEGVPVNTYDDEGFMTDNKGFKYYYENDELCSYVGVDVSAYNGEIDWKAVKACGVDFAMLRIGGRGYGEEGVMYEDEYFLDNYRGAKAAGLQVGAYFFSQAATVEEAVEEAEYALEILDGKKLDYPLAFDWEIIESADYTRIDDVMPDTLTEAARAFCDTVKAEGYEPSLYTGYSLAYYKYDLSQLSDIDIWYAQYNTTADLYYNYMMWQYTDSGTVDGIDGDVDLNICFKNY